VESSPACCAAHAGWWRWAPVGRWWPAGPWRACGSPSPPATPGCSAPPPCCSPSPRCWLHPEKLRFGPAVALTRRRPPEKRDPPAQMEAMMHRQAGSGSASDSAWPGNQAPIPFSILGLT
jgi:hypothetical protein